VAKRLAQEPGPWYRKIRLANEDKSVIKERPVGTSTFGSTLRPALMDAWMRACIIALQEDGEHTIAELAGLFSVGRSTVYRAIERARTRTAEGKEAAA
jgi:hypothetical protein